MKVKRRTERDHLARIADLEEQVRSARRVYQIAIRDAMQLSALVDAASHAASAAEAYIAAGLPQRAQDCLSVVKGGHIDSLRARVAREPGGVLYEEPRGTTSAKREEP